MHNKINIKEARKNIEKAGVIEQTTWPKTLIKFAKNKLRGKIKK